MTERLGQWQTEHRVQELEKRQEEKELEQKAKEYLKENCCEMCMLADDCKADTVNCFSKDCYIKGYEAGLYDKHADREEDIIHLSKENAELKAEIAKLHKCSRCMSNGKDINEMPCKNCLKDGIYTNWH